MIKCGRGIFVAQSSRCNRFGIDWLQRHLSDDYRVHEVEVYDTHPMRIDATFYPLAPGKLLVNPERVPKVPEMFNKSGWDILVCPEPLMPESHPMYNCSRWISMNVLMLDEERVIVSKGEDTLIRTLKDWGFKPIPCIFYDLETIAGGFHCASLDIRRKGELTSYFYNRSFLQHYRYLQGAKLCHMLMRFSGQAVKPPLPPTISPFAATPAVSS